MGHVCEGVWGYWTVIKHLQIIDSGALSLPFILERIVMSTEDSDGPVPVLQAVICRE